MLSRRQFLASTALLGAGCSPRLVHEERSAFSHIRVRADGSIRSLMFITGTGREITQTRLDLQAPHELLSPYTRYMFLSQLLVSDPRRVLLVGLGGGAMVHFLARYYPRTIVDAVEIDPAIVRVAGSHFGVVASARLHIHTADIYEFVRDDHGPYDTVYMDAFLPPATGTDPGGAPLRVKTTAFYRHLRQRLAPNAAVTFNAIDHPYLAQDIETIDAAFSHPLVFDVPGTRNRVIVAGTAPPPDRATLGSRAASLDAALDVGFEFAELLSHQAAPPTRPAVHDPPRSIR
ncbi:MAG: hypothetical protein B7733_07430 [Myxococcales bacterium FL481]|nr:MAG: hypothetical protein B7733_07430 [Myxococcales bacterium FL481]